MNKIINKGHMGKTIEFSSRDDLINFLKDFNSKSIAIEKFESWMYESKYNILEFDFKSLIIKNLIEKKLYLVMILKIIITIFKNYICV